MVFVTNLPCFKQKLWLEQLWKIELHISSLLLVNFLPKHKQKYLLATPVTLVLSQLF